MQGACQSLGGGADLVEWTENFLSSPGALIRQVVLASASAF